MVNSSISGKPDQSSSVEYDRPSSPTAPKEILKEENMHNEIEESSISVKSLKKEFEKESAEFNAVLVRKSNRPTKDVTTVKTFKTDESWIARSEKEGTEPLDLGEELSSPSYLLQNNSVNQESADMPERIWEPESNDISSTRPLHVQSVAVEETYVNGTGSPRLYNQSHLHGEIVYESIGDTSLTKSKFESMAVPERSFGLLKVYHDSLRDQPGSGQRPINDDSYDLRFQQSQSVNLPRTSKEIRQELDVMAQEIDQSQRQFYSLPRTKGSSTLKQQRSSSSERYPDPLAQLDITTGIDADRDRERRLLLIYMRNNRELLDQIGIKVPPHVYSQMDNVASKSPTAVALVEVAGDGLSKGVTSPLANMVNVQDDVFSTDWPDGYREDNKTKGTATRRYIKNVKSTTPAPLAIARKMPSQKPGKESPEALSPSSVELRSEIMTSRNRVLSNSSREEGSDSEPVNYRSAGESLVAKEIREAKEREAELSQSRSELGLPSLDEILGSWRGSTDPNYPLRDAVSLENLQKSASAADSTYTTISNAPAQPKQRSSSLSHLTHLDQTELSTTNDYARNDITQQPSAVRGSLRLWEDGAQLSDLDARTGARTPSGASVDWQTPRTPSSRSRTPSGRKLSKGQYQLFVSSYNENSPIPPEVRTPVSPYTPFVETDLPASTTYRKRQSYVPVEARIEQEVEELRLREEELRKQRETQNLDYLPLQQKGNEDVITTSEPDDVRSPVYSHQGSGQFNAAMMAFRNGYKEDEYDVTIKEKQQAKAAAGYKRKEDYTWETPGDVGYSVQTRGSFDKAQPYYDSGSYKVRGSDRGPKAVKPASHYKGTKLADGMII